MIYRRLISAVIIMNDIRSRIAVGAVIGMAIARNLLA